MRVLSLDGGGIRGLMQAIALEQLEQCTGVRIQDQFDMIVGTSTGGILAIALATGRSPADIIRLYQSRGAEIFSRPWWWFGITGVKYSDDGIERVLQEELGYLPLSSAKKRVAVATYSMEERDTVLLKSWSHKPAVTCWEAARATSAAPTFFPPFGERSYTDGGVWANNPAMLAIDEARRAYPGDAFRVLSIGTGRIISSFEGASGWGMAGWATKIVSLFMEAQARAVERACERELGERYARVQVRLEGDWPMDCVEPSYMRKLRDAGMDAARQIEQLVRTGWMDEDRYEEAAY